MRHAKVYFVESEHQTAKQEQNFIHVSIRFGNAGQSNRIKSNIMRANNINGLRFGCSYLGFIRLSLLRIDGHPLTGKIRM